MATGYSRIASFSSRFSPCIDVIHFAVCALAVHMTFVTAQMAHSTSLRVKSARPKLSLTIIKSDVAVEVRALLKHKNLAHQTQN